MEGEASMEQGRYEELQQAVQLVAWADELRAMAAIGQLYGHDSYDLERYQRLAEIATEMLAGATGLPSPDVRALLARDLGYVTVKVGVATAVFDQRGRQLLVRRRDNGLWAMAGGWADIGDSPAAMAAREVILCGGVINSPQLLMLSGIGDPAALRTHGIAVAADLPGVGQNLQDHASIVSAYRRRTPGSFHAMMRADRIGVAIGRAYLTGRGGATILPGGSTGFVRTDPSLPAPDVQFLFNAAPITAAPWLPPFREPYADAFASRIVLLRPESRGSVTLASADPAAKPILQQNFLATDRDRATLRHALAITRDIMHRPALANMTDRELTPGSGTNGDGGVDAYIRATMKTVHHPLGTCRMGDAADGAVTDAELRVHGMSGLRVVDASVMPDMIGGNINAAIIMIAERAADLIRGRRVLAEAGPMR